MEHEPNTSDQPAGGITISIRLDNGELSEWVADEGLYAQYLELKAGGLLGGALVRELIEVDPQTPPLSVRFFGADPTGAVIDELVCYTE